jgi:hypothetical protein
MTRCAPRIVAIALAILASTSLAAAQRVIADVSGKWLVTGSSPSGPVESTLVLKQEGRTLTGTIEIARVGFSKVTGTVAGDTVRYTFPLNSQGTPIEVRVNAVLKDNDSMTGTVELPGDMGSHPFFAKRQPTSP